MSYGEDLLAKYISIMLPEVRVIRNFRPPWMRTLELDFWFPDQKLAIEFQGDHHYCPTTYSEDYKETIRRDHAKYSLVRGYGGSLIRLDAIDLEWSRLRCKFKGTGRLKRCIKHSSELKKLNQLAKEYRRTLITNYNSVSARKRHSQVRRDVLREKLMSGANP